MKIEIELVKERETKNTVRYDAKGAAAISSIYVNKLALSQPYPEKVKLTLEAE